MVSTGPTKEQVRKAEKHKEAILKVWRQHPDRMEIGALFTSANAILGAMDDATAESAELPVACVEFARQTAKALAGEGGDSEHWRKCMNYQDGLLEGVAGVWPDIANSEGPEGSEECYPVCFHNGLRSGRRTASQKT